MVNPFVHEISMIKDNHHNNPFQKQPENFRRTFISFKQDSNRNMNMNINNINGIPIWLINRYNDESFPTWNQNRVKNKKPLQIWSAFIKKITYIKPESNWLLIWNFFFLVSVMFNFYETPISMFFTDAVYIAQFNSTAGIFLNTMFSFVIAIHIFIIRPITAYYHEGKLIFKIQAIGKRYIKYEFWFNLLAFVFLMGYILSNNPDSVYGKIFVYGFVVSLFRTKKIVKDKLQAYRTLSAIFKLISMLSMLLVLLIWIASIFFAIDYYYYLQKNEYYPTNLWLTNSLSCQFSDLQFIDLIQEYNWYVWFNYSMYWVLQTVTGVGYGDITPRNPVEVAYCDLVIVMFCLFYAAFLNSVWQIINDVTEDRYTSRNQIKFYEINYGVEKQLLAKLENYSFEAAKARQWDLKEKEINERLSDQLRKELQIAREGQTFIHIAYFRELSHLLGRDYSLLFQNLISKIKEQRYGEGETLLSRGNQNVSLFTLSTGEVMLSYPNTKFKLLIKENTNQNFFGVHKFLIRDVATYDAVTTKYSKISHISQQGFMEAVHTNQPFRIQCHFLYEEIAIYGKYQLTSQKCWGCQEQNHNLETCSKYFDWLQSIRNCVQIFHQRQLNKIRIPFRIYRDRKPRSYHKIIKNKSYNSRSNTIQNKRSYNMVEWNKKSLIDKLSLKNKNKSDKIMNYSNYRQFYNIYGQVCHFEFKNILK